MIVIGIICIVIGAILALAGVPFMYFLALGGLALIIIGALLGGGTWGLPRRGRAG